MRKNELFQKIISILKKFQYISINSRLNRTLCYMFILISATNGTLYTEVHRLLLPSFLRKINTERSQSQLLKKRFYTPSSFNQLLIFEPIDFDSISVRLIAGMDFKKSVPYEVVMIRLSQTMKTPLSSFVRISRPKP